MKLEPRELKRLFKGGIATLQREDDPRMHAGRSYSVQTSGGKPGIAFMRCLEIWQDADGWTVKVQLDSEDKPRFMGRWPDYVTERHRSIDPDCEVVPEQWLTDHLTAREGRSTLTRAQEVEQRLLACRTFEERLVALRSLARSQRIDVRSEFRLIDRLRREGKVSRVERLAVRVEARIRDQAA